MGRKGLCALLLLGAEHTAGGADVFATGGADGGRYARLAEPIAEPLHAGHIGAGQVDVRDAVVADQVDVAVELGE